MVKSSHLLLFLLLALCFLDSSSNSLAASSLNPSIFDEDGSLPCNGTDIPFPFVISGNLTPHPLLPGFNITCKQQNGSLQTSPPRLLLHSTELPLLDISLNEGFVRVDLEPFSWRCDRGFVEEPRNVSELLEGSPFTFSSTRNVLTVVGCDALVFLRQQQVNKSGVKRSCVSFCESTESVVDGLCSGVGCCQASIPEKLKSFELEFKSIRNITGSHFNVSACSRALIVEQKAFAFSAKELNGGAEGGAPRSVVLDWSIGNKSCEEAKRRGKDYYICADKAVCNDSSNGIGYLCRCKEGYEGNPYVPDGCTDIDECRNNATSPCHWKCKNSDGSYRCSCPFGTTGDGKKAGSGCKRVAPIEIALAAGFCLLLLLFVVGFLSYRKLKQRSVEKLKQKHFMQNGGLLLQKHFSARQAAAAKIFTAGELEMATDKFSESRILGRGGYGTVYKGVLSDGREIAIKKSKLVDETQIEPFINEMVILSQIKHRNVVKLLGCCLETQVPLLVYEFISNGTLFDHIHSDCKTFSLSWEIRLRIAGEAAAALAYLHKADHSTPIIHRDVKSANILLDEGFTAKVSDFGASRLVPFNQTHVTTVVQGTLGYLDPEYFHTGLLSEKSDVYSFGVVLVELLTAESPVSFAKSEEERNLASYFVRMVKANRILDVADRRVAEDAGHMSLSAFAELANSCLNVRGEDRPMMMEVAVELEALRRLSRLSRPPERLRGEEQSRCLLQPLSICRCEGEISAEEKLL